MCDALVSIAGLANSGLQVAADVAIMLIDSSIMAQKMTAIFGNNRSMPAPLARYGIRTMVAVLALYYQSARFFQRICLEPLTLSLTLVEYIPKSLPLRAFVPPKEA
jgi:hypothetical protein